MLWTRRFVAVTGWSLVVAMLVGGASVNVDLRLPPTGMLRRFWTSTGLSPACDRSEVSEFLLGRDELLNLALIGSLPNKAITQVRIHWLLDLISVTGHRENGEPMLNYTSLDKLLDHLHSFGLAPGFELMGNPSNYFSDFENENTADVWRGMVKDIALRYIERYGLENVSKWRFELWNEPDLRMYNILNFTLRGYISYAEASWRGLQQASPDLRMGGPAGLFKAKARHPLCWGLLEHCANSANCPISFVSFHRKGGGSADYVLESGMRLVRKLRSRYPSLRNLPVANDEADPLTGWWRSEPWREDVRYAAMVVRAVVQHQDVMVRQGGVSLELLGNDNGFLSFYPHFFSQRTLTARFQMNDTSPHHVQFFLKPVYAAMALLSLMGGDQLTVSLDPSDDRMSVLASAQRDAARPWSAAVLLALCNNTAADLAGVNFTVRLRHLPSSAGTRYAVLQLGSNPGPAEVWRSAGAPDFPDGELRRRMRAAQGAVLTSEGVAGEHLELTLALTLPSVALLQVCSMPTLPPGQVLGLRAFNVTHGEVVLVWSDIFVSTSCVRTYEVEFSRQVAPPRFHRLNHKLLHFLSYHHAAPLSLMASAAGSLDDPASGVYRVRAVDFWGRPGSYSQPLVYPGPDGSQHPA